MCFTDPFGPINNTYRIPELVIELRPASIAPTNRSEIPSRFRSPGVLMDVPKKKLCPRTGPFFVLAFIVTASITSLVEFINKMCIAPLLRPRAFEYGAPTIKSVLPSLFISAVLTA